jgi:hypothetical protein
MKGMGESVDVIDYTLLRKKGILQRAGARSPSPSSSSNPLASFLPSAASAPPVSPPSSPGGFFGFMDNPASPSPSSSSLDASSLSALQIKVDDLDYKLQKMTEQLALLEAKLGSLGTSS